ncbi:MAG: hypothetical protein QOE41_2872, partial [Mycobacterium sp.]|nr:hypothetical protein [Mycobacterium sp.]
RRRRIEVALERRIRCGDARGKHHVEHVVGVAALVEGTRAIPYARDVILVTHDSLTDKETGRQNEVLTGVRMVTVSGRPATRISRGSSTTNVSGRTGRPGPTSRITRRRLVMGPNLGHLGGNCTLSAEKLWTTLGLSE